MAKEKEQKTNYLYNFIDMNGSKWKINNKRLSLFNAHIPDLREDLLSANWNKCYLLNFHCL